MQHKENSHRFRIIDCMILVATFAVSLYLCRTSLKDFLPAAPSTRLRADNFGTVRDTLPYIASFLMPPTLACFFMEIWGTWTNREQRFRTAGTMAATAAIIVVLMQAVSTTVLLLAGTRSDFIGSPANWGMSSHPGSAVMSLWAVLWLRGEWQMKSDWNDWFGLALGLGWACITFASWLGFILIG